MDTKRNRHPVDRLGDIRAEMRELKAEEKRLRDMFDPADGEAGAEYVATYQTNNSARVDWRALERHFGAEAVAPFIEKRSTRALYVKRRKDVRTR